jgi:hypothetical protein
MITDYNILTTPFSLYLCLNWFFCLACAFWIGVLFYKRRYLFVKPSLLTLSWYHLFFQWPLAFYSGHYMGYLPDPYTFAFLIHGYILIGLLVCPFTLDLKANKIWGRIAGFHKEEPLASPGAMVLLGAIIIGITLAYLSQVPLSQTGLYTIFFRPEVSVIAREKSLKLLGNMPLVYAYSLMVSCAAPLLAVMLFWALRKAIKRWQIFSILFYIILLVGLAVSIGLPGARISIVNMILVMVIAYLFHRGLPLRLGKFLFLIGTILLLPAILTILREGKEISLETLFAYLGYIGHRAFVVPMDVGSWYIHYTQVEGGFGVAGIPKLAALLGRRAVNVPNFIGLKYEGGAYTSVTSPAGYLFAYYSYFGMISLVISLAGVFLLDIAVFFYERLSDRLLLPCIAAIGLSTLSFISSDYTTAWLTHGFGVILVLSWCIDRCIHWAANLKYHVL